MKDATAAIRAGYIEKLSPLSVGIFDQLLPVNRNDDKYILLTSQTQDADRTKDRFKTNCTIIADINVRVGNPTGKLQCDQIADQVMRLINPLRSSDYIDLGEDFTCIRTTVLQNETMHDMIATGHNYRRIIRFQHTVLEN